VKPFGTHGVLAFTFLLATVACSGGSGGPAGPGNQSGSRLTASIDGSPWTSTLGAELNGVPLVLPGVYSIAGVQSNSYILVIGLFNIPGPGTYPLGVGPQVAGGFAQVSNATGGWVTPQSGAAGSITLTTLTSSRMAGTFNFTAVALTGTATGTRTVTNGNFDLEVRPTGSIGPLPPNAGSKVGAVVGGAAFNAAAASGSLLTSGTPILTVVGNNDARSLTISLTGVSTPGTYALSAAAPTRVIGVANTTNTFANTWSSNGPGGAGSVTVTAITAARIQGTFTATLGPAPGTTTTGSLTVTSGIFDIGRIN